MPTVLLVDDDLDSLWPIQLALEGRGHHVVMAGNGQDALDKMARRSIHLVVTDWEMPEVDGVELCRQLRRHLHTAHLPIVLLSAEPEPSDGRRNWSLFFRKPVDPVVLLEHIDVLLAGRLTRGSGHAGARTMVPAPRWPGIDARCWP